MSSPLLLKIRKQIAPCTAIIGGGGKTTLMLSLAHLLASEGHSVLVTTTTHLAWPPPKDIIFCSPAEPNSLSALAKSGTVVMAGIPCEKNRMTGVPFSLETVTGFDYILCEADGSARLPLKVHKETEPVIPGCAGLVIQVAGLTALGRTAEETVHRYALAGLHPQEIVTPEIVTALLLRGWDHWSAGGLTLLNQADTPDIYQQGAWIAERMEEKGFPTLVGALDPKKFS